jgi:hypothetical protein
MIQGFIPDYAYGQSQQLVSSWIEDHPKKSWFTGTKVPWEGQMPIGAFRCKGCGYLEFYADEKFAAQ